MTSTTMSDCMDNYHEYLTTNYRYGVDRFFAPTGFLENFEKRTALSASARREAVYARTVDDAQAKLEPVVAGGEGVFDLVAEPGTGKTTVLPFRFPSKKVVVALPTPFDAWSAYNTASGPAKLRLKGLKLGKDERVCYMDSYMAANMIMSGFQDYDVLIVDECDSGKGVTGFLADVKAPGKILVRMSASHGRSGGGPSSSFLITETATMPDIRDGVKPVADYVLSKTSGRAVVMTPDADSAALLAKHLPGAKIISAKTPLGSMSRALTDKASVRLFVADDVCSRGVNLDLDMVFDCQLLTEHGVTRNLTQAEVYQRRNRVGRNRAGYYYSPGLPTMEPGESDADIMRSNIVRVHAGLEQVGGAAARVTPSDVVALLLSDEEPYTVQARAAIESHSPRRSLSSGSSSSVVSFKSGRSSSTASRASSTKVALPSWMLWAATVTGKADGGAVYSVSQKGVHRSRSTSGGSSTGPSMKQLMAPTRRREGVMAPRRHTAVSSDAPYAAKVVEREETTVTPLNNPRSPPVMDLSASEYELDWPGLLGDLVDRCSDMPTIVPPHGWMHTSVGGMGSNWLRRLDTLAVSELVFSAEELEVVCRAWNTVVAGTWVKRAPGLSAYAHRDQLEFCLRYFQSYYNMAVTG